MGSLGGSCYTPPRKVHPWQINLTNKLLTSGCSNACQEFGCMWGIGAGLRQVYLAHAALFGYWGRLMIRHTLLANPGKARGCSTITAVTDSFSNPFPPTALRRCHDQILWDSSSNYKIGYVIVIKNFLNPEGHQNPIRCSKLLLIYCMCQYYPLVELHREGSAPASEIGRKKGILLTYKIVQCLSYHPRYQPVFLSNQTEQYEPNRHTLH